VSVRRLQELQKSQGQDAWLVTFADISALMLAFFVMLFSMSSLELDKWQAVTSRMTKGEPAKVQLRPAPNSEYAVPTIDIPPALPLGYLAQILDEKLKPQVDSGQVQIHRLDKMLVVSLPADVLFTPDKATLTPRASQALFGVSSALAQIGNQIDIQGHTAPAASSSTGVDWKWQLSLERAAAVADELKRIGYQGNPAILGLADSRFGFLDSTIPEAKRLELARRVDFVIHPTEGEP
jgi:chemotaxis protein MotB